MSLQRLRLVAVNTFIAIVLAIVAIDTLPQSPAALHMAIVPTLGPHRAAGVERRRSRRRGARDLSRGDDPARRGATLAKHARAGQVRRRLGPDHREAQMNTAPWSLRATAAALASGWHAFFH